MKNKNQLAKVCCMVLMLLLLTTSSLFAAVCGDVNSDGKVNIVDALLTAQRYVGIRPPVFDESVADVNGDAAINIIDALLMARYYVGLEKELTGCQSGEANLAPSRFSSPSSSVPGGEVGLDMSLFVTNNGSTEAQSSEGYIFIGFYLSKNNTWDNSDTLLLGGRESVETPIAASQTKSVSIFDGMSIPEKTEPGDYYLLAVVDEMNTVSESNEKDNVAARPITIGSAITDKIIIFDAGSKEGALGGRKGADLLCTSYAGMQADLAGKEVRAFISVSASDEIRDMPSLYGVPTNLPVVSMSGKKIADNWADLLDGTIDMTLSDADILTYQFWYSGSNANGSLSDKNCTNWTSSNGYLDGRYGRWVFTDANWITLGDATCGLTNYHILGIAWDKADEPNLVPAKFTSPSSSTPGGVVGADLTLSVTNNGTGPADNSVGYIFAGFYLSTNRTLDSTDVLLKGGRESVSTPIAAGQTKGVSIYDGMSIPEGTAPGNYYLLAVVDEQKTVAESNENDNVAARPITIVSDAKIIMFDAGGKRGALGGRRGADLLCTSYAGMQSQLSGKKVRAFISVSASDEIRDMPSLYGVPTNLPIVSMTGKKIADNWADLLDGTIDMTLSDADILTYQFWYSGSNANGSLSDTNCSNWTSSNGFLDGRYGRWVFTDANWITLGDATCGLSNYHILGLAW